MNQDRIGKYILKKRKELNLTQEQLAEKLGVTNRSVSRWENGKTLPDLSIFRLLCETLNITLEELLSGEDHSKGNNETINYLKYQKKIYKYRLLIVIVFSLLILLGIIYLIFKPYKLEFSDSIDYAKPIYNIDSKRKLYSFYNNNNYIKNTTIDLSEALNKGLITIEQIKNNMIFEGMYNDGGSRMYKSKDSKYYLYECHSIMWQDENQNEYNENYYISGSKDDINVCKYKKEIGLNFTCLYDKLDNIIEYDKSKNHNENYNARLITNGNIPSWDIYSGAKGWYAIIKTSDEMVINDFKNWFNDKDNNYYYTNIYDNWYLFISNGNDFDFRELNDCIN